MVPKSTAASQYPGIYLFTTVARMMRPVWNYLCKSVEMIGTFEQVYLNIAVTDEDAQRSVSAELPSSFSFSQYRAADVFILRNQYHSEQFKLLLLLLFLLLINLYGLRCFAFNCLGLLSYMFFCVVRFCLLVR